ARIVKLKPLTENSQSDHRFGHREMIADTGFGAGAKRNPGKRVPTFDPRRKTPGIKRFRIRPYLWIPLQRKRADVDNLILAETVSGKFSVLLHLPHDDPKRRIDTQG